MFLIFLPKIKILIYHFGSRRKQKKKKRGKARGSRSREFFSSSTKRILRNWLILFTYFPILQSRVSAEKENFDFDFFNENTIERDLSAFPAPKNEDRWSK
jgi:hypothetical protein